MNKQIKNEFDLIIIGGGPGGYVSAIRAAQLGIDVCVIDNSRYLGGTCLNVGCIPSKTMLFHSHVYHSALHSMLVKGDISFDFEGMKSQKESVLKQLGGGVESLFKKNKITFINGFAAFEDGNSVNVGNTSYTAKNIIIATGSVPRSLSAVDFDGKIMSSDHIFDLKQQPAKLAIIGAGVIGVEMGSVFNAIGTEVHVYEMMKEFRLPCIQQEVANELLNAMEKDGMSFHFSAKVNAITQVKNNVHLNAMCNGEDISEKYDNVLVAIGRIPNTKDLNLNAVGVTCSDRGNIIVDSNFKTSVDHIYALGDVIEGTMLAHTASEEGVRLVEYLAGKRSQVDYTLVPSVVYTYPEVASVGFTTDELKSKGVAHLIGKSSIKHSSRGVCTGQTHGNVVIIVDKNTRRLLGMHICAANASEMISFASLAIHTKISVDDLQHVIFAHPTLSEAIKEAILSVDKLAIHS
ncbi:dihydrolipoyl dehydrogenase [Chlamydiia bacterium]|nr:dihydrolipoyl dehydrogenase [Chlamydiia bacterium]